ncbi:hypothetical protein ACHQM5_007349 [Ranunculus cassubicifolius]
MLLQSSSPSSPPLQNLHQFSSNSPQSHLNLFNSFPFLRKHRTTNNSIITCYIPQVYNYSKSDKERKPSQQWTVIYRRISLMENPEVGSSIVLNQLEREKQKFNRWELCRVVKELRKFRRFKLALEVLEWMNDRPDRFTLSSSDAAIQLDLISKVHGVSRSEEYFSTLSGTLKDKRTYGSLLNAYARLRMKEKAESLIEEMNRKGFAHHSLPYNVMMTLYMKIKDYKKAISMVSKMTEKGIPFDIYTYNIWMTACGGMGSAEKMEEVLEKMKLDQAVTPNWTTYSTMATMYMNLDEFKKAKECLRLIEGSITGRERIAFHYLISLYGSLGEKEEVYRIWKTYQSSFPNTPNLGYHSMIAALLRVDDIEGAEKIYEEWLPLRTSFDPRICNLLIGCYVKNDFLEKAEDFLDQALEVGGKANAYTFELLADGHIKKRHIPEALAYFKQATLAEKGLNWRPNPSILSNFISLCEEESDLGSKKTFIELMKKAGCFEYEVYKSIISPNGTGEFQAVENDSEEDDMILNQLQGSL